MGILFVISIILAIVFIARDKSADYHCRKYAQEHGYEQYASSTGLRYTKDNSLVFDINNKR